MEGGVSASFGNAADGSAPPRSLRMEFDTSHLYFLRDPDLILPALFGLI